MATKWKIDPTHSEITFKVKHLMISTVTGNFKVFEGEAESDTDEFQNIRNVEFKADAGSINTNNDQRDEHLRSADFFAADEHPYIEFKAQNLDPTTDKIEGELNIRGTRKPLVLDMEFGGTVVDQYGQKKAGLTATGEISRKEYGLTWDAVTEAGSVVVSDKVKLNVEVQFVKQ